MKIFISAIGSRGDVQPYIALGKGLKAAGHEVTLCVTCNFESFVKEHGLNYAYLNDEIMQIIDSPELRTVMDKGTDLFQMVKAGWRMMKIVAPIEIKLVRECWDAVKEFKPDCIVYHPKAIGCPYYADQLGIPAIFTMLQPIMFPTSEFPNMMFPQLKLGGWYNRLTYSLLTRIAVLKISKFIKIWRKENGISGSRRCRSLFSLPDGSRIPVLHGYSPHVSPEPKDWPEDVIASGYWFLDSTDDWQPPEALHDFLEAGPPPVYVGFGSMAGRYPERLAGIVVEALKKSGVRGIIATGWGGLAPEDLPETIMQVDQVPHDWLFERVSAVVHHGGGGTTAAGLRAGCPTVICPFIVDQPFWGRCVERLGAGPKAIPQRKLTSEKLAASIKEAISNPEMRINAERIGEKLKAEDGIARAIAFIEKHCR